MKVVNSRVGRSTRTSASSISITLTKQKGLRMRLHSLYMAKYMNFAHSVWLIVDMVSYSIAVTKLFFFEECEPKSKCHISLRNICHVFAIIIVITCVNLFCIGATKSSLQYTHKLK